MALQLGPVCIKHKSGPAEPCGWFPWIKWSFLLVLRAPLSLAWSFADPSPSPPWEDMCWGPWPCLLPPPPALAQDPHFPASGLAQGWPHLSLFTRIPPLWNCFFLTSIQSELLFLCTNSLSVSSSDTWLHHRLYLFVFPWEQRPNLAHLSGLPSRSCFLNSVPWIVEF